MLLFFLLTLLAGPVVSVRVGAGSAPRDGGGYDWIVSAFLSWRVTRGGRISRMLLILGTGLGYLATALSLATHFRPATFGVLAICLVQLALLMSPSVYWRTRPRHWAEPPAATRVLPPLTLLLLGVLAGLCVTLIGLSHMVPGPAVHGCTVTGDMRAEFCDTLADGAPLYWVSLHDAAAYADWAAMARDWAQWAVVATSVLYALWLGAPARHEPLRTRFPSAAVVGAALCGLTFAVLDGRFPAIWLTRGHYDPAYHEGRAFSAHALLADAATWTLAATGVCVAVWLTGRWLRSRPARGEPRGQWRAETGP